MFNDMYLFDMRPSQRSGKEKLEGLFGTYGWGRMISKNKPSERDRSPNKSRGPKGKKRKW